MVFALRNRLGGVKKAARAICELVQVHSGLSFYKRPIDHHPTCGMAAFGPQPFMWEAFCLRASHKRG
jgi:hypothetical protein